MVILFTVSKICFLLLKNSENKENIKNMFDYRFFLFLKKTHKTQKVPILGNKNSCLENTKRIISIFKIRTKKTHSFRSVF